MHIYIYIYIRVRNLPLRDMISLGAWKMGHGCSGKICPSSSPSPTRMWKMDSSRVSLRNRRFRSARIDPSRRAVAKGYMYVNKNPYKKIKYRKRVEKEQKRPKTGIAQKSPLEISLTPIPLRGLLCTFTELGVVFTIPNKVNG